MNSLKADSLVKEEREASAAQDKEGKSDFIFFKTIPFMQIFRKRITHAWLIQLVPILILLNPRTLPHGAFRVVVIIFAIVLGIPMSLAALTKLFVHKERPQPAKRGVWRRHIWAGSFPSMHTISVFALTMLLRMFFSGTSFIRRMFPGYIVIAVLVAISRVKLKKHYRRDIR